MKKLTVTLKLIFFSLLFISCGKLFRFLLVDDTSSYTRIMMHELYHQEENIDILFVGSSHCYFSFVPAITDEIFGVNTFNAGSSSQQMDASYELIREVAKENDLKQIYLEVYYRMGDTEEHKDRTLMTSTYLISDYMKPSLRKLAFLLQASSKEHYFNSFIIARRDWEKFFDSDYVMSLIQKKATPDYRNYEYTYVTKEGSAYMGKGYVTNDGVSPEYYFESCWPMYVEGFSEDWEKYLKKIIQFCDKEGIQLTLVAAPMPNYTLAGKGNYDDYGEKIAQIIDGTDVKYYDFNLCKEEYIPNTTAIFRESDHLNTQGAEIFSTVFAKFFTGQISEDALFYDSFKEKLENLEPMVFGISYQDRPVEGKEEPVRYMEIVASRRSGMEYRIIMTPEEGEQYMVQDFSENRTFEISPNDHGVCTIVVRGITDSINDVLTIEIEY